jgi:hypothetical protein
MRLTAPIDGELQCVLAGPMVHAAPARIDHEHVGMRAHQPGRRGGRRRTQHDLQAGLARQAHRRLEPLELEAALLRLHERPRELCHVDELEPVPLDVLEVARPLLARPCLGIVVNADRHHVAIGKPVPR